MSNNKTSAINAMTGLAIGDAMSWPAMFHRSFLLPKWTRRIRREIDAEAEIYDTIILPMPFSLNQPPERFNFSPTDDTEWAAFSAEVIIRSSSGSYENEIIESWNRLAKSETIIRGAVSTQAALRNIRKGIMPPQSGRENPHYFDDSAMPRAVPIGIVCAGQPDKAAEMALMDASVTNSEDGIWAAQAIAVSISLLCAGKTIDEAVSSSMEYIPEESWSRRIIDEAFLLAERSGSIFSILPELNSKIVNREYSYGNAAPETLALTFLIAKQCGDDLERALTTALAFPKCSDTLPAMVGAITGAIMTAPEKLNSWLESVRFLNGICIPVLAGKDFLLLAGELSNIILKDNVL